MHVSVRSHLAAGVAVLGVGAVVLAPVHMPAPQTGVLPTRAAEMAVDLAAAVDPLNPIAAIIDAATQTANNVLGLANQWANGTYVEGTYGGDNPLTVGYKTGRPLPIISQMIGNAQIYFGELPDVGGILGQVFGNIGKALGSPFVPGEEVPVEVPFFDEGFANQNLSANKDFGQFAKRAVSPRTSGATLPFIAPDLAAALKPILTFATTPISGLLLGAVGPILGPVLSVVNSITNSFALLGEGKFLGALTELVNIPTNAVNAFLNGGPTLDATRIIGLIADLPPEISSIGFKMGGILSRGGVAGDALAATGVVEIPSQPGKPQELSLGGIPIGPIGTLIGMDNYAAVAIKVEPKATQQAAAAPVKAAAAVPAAASVSAPAPVADAPAPLETPAAPAIDVPASTKLAASQNDPAPDLARAGRGHRGGGNGGADNDNAGSSGARGHRGPA